MAFGGPAAHVTLMRRVLVLRRKWVGEEEFFSLFAAVQLIPGPSSTELALLLGYKRAGWRGLLVAGVCFIAPAALLMLGLAALYQHVGSLDVAQRLLRGVTPVVVGIVVWAVIDLGRRVARRWDALLVLVAVAVLAVFVNQPIALLASGGIAITIFRRLRDPRSLAGAGALDPRLLSATAGVTAVPASLLAVFATFLKLGAVAFGSGYVLLVFLRSELVINLHWLTDRQVVDAVAISQATPGPVFTTATFIGFLVAGVAGAAVATAGIFLPGFLLVPPLERVARMVAAHPWLQDALNGVNAASLGLMVAVAIALARESFTGAEPVVAAVMTLLVLLRFPLAAPLLVVGGAAAGALLG
ncbi:MAG: chromate efflux transporter [Chloroflexi bacterium]|nr:chromate efflux transporter [Chloroflexota bacterium]